MSVVIILILASLAVALLFLAAFIWSVRSGQYEDTLTPAMRMLVDEPAGKVGPILGETGRDAVPLPVPTTITNRGGKT
jgi:cbb3-type cytochrome oxidase maturation protein